MDWHRHAGLSERWQSLCRGHAQTLNEGLRRGIHAPLASSADDRASLAGAVLEIVAEANEAGETVALRGLFTPAYHPFVEGLEDRAEPVGTLLLLDDGRVAVVAGGSRRRLQAWLVTPDSSEPLVGVFALGRSSNRRIIALGRPDGVHLARGWGGPIQTVIPWPDAYGPAHPEMPVPTNDHYARVTALLPYNDGERVIIVSRSGIFAATSTSSALIHPSPADLGGYVDEDGDEAFPLDLASVHASAAPNSDLLVVGDQDSPHRILTSDGDLLVAVPPTQGHVQWAASAVDAHGGEVVALSSTDNGQAYTAFADASILRSSLRWHPEAELTTVEAPSPVTAATAWPGTVALGHADGFIRLYRSSGEALGEVFVGSPVRAIDATADRRWVAVGTQAGVLHILDLAPAERSPWAIGRFDHAEVRRYLFWRAEASPLIW